MVGLDSAQLKLDALDSRGERWLLDHREAAACGAFKLFLGELNAFFGEVFELDLRLREDSFGGFAYSAELDEALENLVMKCYFSAVKAERTAERFAAGGYAVDGVEPLRDWLRELGACSNPRLETSDWSERKRAAAEVEHAGGQTVLGWTD